MELTTAGRLIVAADYDPNADGSQGVFDRVRLLCRELEGLGVVIKVNSILRARGYGLLREIKQMGLKTFADLKLNDIPKTMETDACLLAEFQPDIVTVMCSAGIEGMKKVKQVFAKESPATEVLGVTVLTTFDDLACKDVYGVHVEEGVIRFADAASAAGIDGLICSPKEAQLLKDQDRFDSLSLNTPGIRYAWAEVKDDDQVRTASAGFAIKNGVQRVVVGRPILGARANEGVSKPQTRREAAEWIIHDIQNALLIESVDKEPALA